MMELLPPQLSLAAAAGLILLSFFTSALTSVASVGGGIALISVMASFLPPLIVLPVHGVVQLGSNAGRTWLMRRHIDKQIVCRFAIGAVVGVVVATQLFIALSTKTLQLLLGLFILFSIWTPKLKPSSVPQSGYVAVGLVATFCSMFVGAVGPFVASFLPADRLQRHGLVATSAACLSTQHTLKICAFGFLGFTFLPWVPVMAAMVMSGFLGTWVGGKLLNRIPERAFRVLFKTVITLLAIRLLYAAIIAP